MLFNSIAFAIFLPIVFALYWTIRPKRRLMQNILLIIASYVFYGWWDWRFLILIAASSMADFIIGVRLSVTDEQAKRKALLVASLAFNLGILGFFKYFNFFVDSFAMLLTSAGMQANMPTLRIILPVGISFYTFQTLSYSIDVYRRRLDATRDPIAFFAFVSFFPQLVAGPIERAKALLPQFQKDRSFDLIQARSGMRQILWGFFKKMVVADTLAPHVESIFANTPQQDGITFLLGLSFFALQVYGDFSGYSDIAIGTARLFGFNLMQNFAFPYFSRDIGEFWRRWHISLSTWFRDYLFIPLGGSRCTKYRRAFNIFITFTVSGFWHGADWSLVVWGAMHGLYYMPIMIRDKPSPFPDTPAEGKLLPGPLEFLAMVGTFGLMLFSFIFFRGQSMTHAFQIIDVMVSTPYKGLEYSLYTKPIIIALVPLVWEWGHRTKQFGLDIPEYPVVARWFLYIVVVAAILIFGKFGAQEFIYFQF